MESDIGVKSGRARVRSAPCKGLADTTVLFTPTMERRSIMLWEYIQSGVRTALLMAS